MHAHGDLPGGLLHAEVSALSAGFAPAVQGSDGWALLKTGSSSSWSAISVSGAVSVGGKNLVGSLIISLSNSIVFDDPLNNNNNIKFSGSLNEALWFGDVSNNKYLRFVSSAGSERVETVSASFQYRTRLTYHTSNITIANTDSSRIISNSGSINPLTASLPPLSTVSDGFFIDGRVATNQYLIFQTNGSDIIQIIDNKTIPGGNLKSIVTGSFITIEKQNNSWFVSKFDGEWEIA